MALPVQASPCSLLDTTKTAIFVSGSTTLLFPDTLLSTATSLTNPEAFFSAAGVLREFADWTTGPTGSILLAANKNVTSGLRLVQFLSGGGQAADAKALSSTTDYSTYGSTLLGLTVGIVKNYFKVTTKGGVDSYTYAPTTPLITDIKLWNDADLATIGAATPTATSIIGNLMKDGFLLKPTEIFATDDTASMYVTDGATTSAAASPTSLFQIYAIENIEGKLTDTQRAIKNRLECKNLRFFGAFFIEYCYYRSRYSALLDLYFNVFTKPMADYVSPTGTTLTNLFSGTGSGFTQYTGTAGTGIPSQADYLKVIAYHLACLNTRLVDMRRLLGQINTMYGAYYKQLRDAINGTSGSTTSGSTTSVFNSLTALQLSAKDTNKYLEEADYRQGVMDYASEKNRYANILLGVYAFLNLSALAVVVYSM